MTSSNGQVLLPPGYRCFEATHRAMATEFRLRIVHESETQARSAAKSAFRIIDEMEAHLSRFRHGSDISCINAAPPDIPVKVSPDAWECLLIASHAWQITAGYSDAALGALVDWYRSHPDTPAPDSKVNGAGMRNIALLPEYRAVVRTHPEAFLDLGSIGKGYALDRVAEHLAEFWSIETFQLESGTSSCILGSRLKDSNLWPVEVPIAHDRTETVHLTHGALGASAAEIKLRHIINPKDGIPIPPRQGAWVFARSAALADAFSTAFSIMPVDDVRKCHQSAEGLVIRIVRADATWSFGQLPQGDVEDPT